MYCMQYICIVYNIYIYIMYVLYAIYTYIKLTMSQIT